MAEPQMKIHIDYWPAKDCVQMKEEPFYGMCRKCNKCGRFKEYTTKEYLDGLREEKDES